MVAFAANNNGKCGFILGRVRKLFECLLHLRQFLRDNEIELTFRHTISVDVSQACLGNQNVRHSPEYKDTLRKDLVLLFVKLQPLNQHGFHFINHLVLVSYTSQLKELEC